MATETESIISSVYGTDIGNYCSILISKKNSAYTHSIKYRFGELSGYIGASGNISAEEEKYTVTSVKFLIPADWAEQIPNSKSGTCTLTCTTYSDSTQVGDPQALTIQLNTYPMFCEPRIYIDILCDVLSETNQVTKNPEVVVRYRSKVRCTYRVTTLYGATVESVVINGINVGNASGSYDFENADTGTYTLVVTDSRGYTYRLTRNLTLIEYVELTNNAVIARTDPTSGNAILSIQGNYFNGTFGKTDNYLDVGYQIGTTGTMWGLEPTISENEFSISAEISGLDYTRNYTIVVTVRDALTTIEKKLTVKKGIPIFDWGETDFQFHVPVSFAEKGTLSSFPVEENNTTDTKAWSYRKYSDGSCDLWMTVPVGKESINTAFGAMFRSIALCAKPSSGDDPYLYPFRVYSPNVSVSFAPGGNDIVGVWIMSSGTSRRLPTFTLVSPEEISAISGGTLSIYVHGSAVS